VARGGEPARGTAGYTANLARFGHRISEATVRRILRRRHQPSAQLAGRLTRHLTTASETSSQNPDTLGGPSLNGPVQIFTAIALVALPTVMFGGFSLLRLLTAGRLSEFQVAYFRAGHAQLRPGISCASSAAAPGAPDTSPTPSTSSKPVKRLVEKGPLSSSSARGQWATTSTRHPRNSASPPATNSTHPQALTAPLPIDDRFRPPGRRVASWL
jgi:hypothetical protein